MSGWMDLLSGFEANKMEVLEKRRYEKPVIRFVTDISVILECLHEVYGMEGEQVLSGKNIYSTMIYPFIKMLENQCEGIPAERLHKVLWEVYEDYPEKTDFLEKASIILKPYSDTKKDETDAKKSEVYGS